MGREVLDILAIIRLIEQFERLVFDIFGLTNGCEIPVRMTDIVMGLYVTIAEFVRHRECIDNPVIPQFIDEQLADELPPILVHLVQQKQVRWLVQTHEIFDLSLNLIFGLIREGTLNIPGEDPHTGL
jgi:hypothetical protein